MTGPVGSDGTGCDQLIDWDDAFDNSGYVDGSDTLIDLWAEEADKARTEVPGPRDLAYGSHGRETLDLFLPDGQPLGLVVFVHGGFWHMLDKSYWSHLCRGAVARGWAFAVINYPLAPEVALTQITASVAGGIARAAAEVPGPVRLIGHSAGGHLVARMACRNAPLAADLRARLQRVVSVSGVHDLRPLLRTRMNETLGLTEAEAKSESPALAAPAAGLPVTFWVGTEERPEFLRQTRLAAEAWQRQGADVSTGYEAGHHHFSVIKSLCSATGSLTQEVLR